VKFRLHFNFIFKVKFGRHLTSKLGRDLMLVQGSTSKIDAGVYKHK